MRLADFIPANIEPILAEWEAFAHGLKAGATMQPLALRDDAESILGATVRDMQSDQSAAQRASKSRGHGHGDGGGGAGGGGGGGDASDRLDSASVLHGAARVGSGFNLVEVVSEYRALRASVLRLWRASDPHPDLRDLDDLTRFDESIDQSLAAAVAAYTRRVDQTRRMFLAILAHDLRNPLNTIALSARLAARDGSVPPDSKEALTQIEASARAIDALVRDLTDFAATGLGAAMPIAPAPLDLGALCRAVIAEVRAAHPDRTITCDARDARGGGGGGAGVGGGGDLTVTGDASRLRQVVSNLLGNAVQRRRHRLPVCRRVRRFIGRLGLVGLGARGAVRLRHCARTVRAAPRYRYDRARRRPVPAIHD